MLLVGILVKVKKGKVHPGTGHKGPEVEHMYSSTLPLTSALDGGRWSTPWPSDFTPGINLVPIVQEAGRAPGNVWTVQKISPPLRFDPRTVQPVDSHYTDYTTVAHIVIMDKM